MAKVKNRQTYPKEDSEINKDTIRKLKSQVRKLQKTVKEISSENSTLLEAWSKTESLLAEATKEIPLEDLLKYKKLPKKALRKKIKENKEATSEGGAKQRLENWIKENL